MEKIVYWLVALQMYIKQYHWLARGYDNHILADKLEDELEDFIDEGAELYKIYGKNDALFARTIFEKARQHVSDMYSGDDMGVYLDNMLQMMAKVMEECDNLQNVGEDVFKLGFSDYSGRLSNLLLRKCYLIGVQRKEGLK